MSPPLDLAHLRRWIGSTSEAEDVVTPGLVERFTATFDLPPGSTRAGDEVVAGLHWCLAPTVVATADLGADGHPARGGFLPPVSLPRRMWAGGELYFKQALRVGDVVRRVSRVSDVALKQGSTGTLCFVVVHHDYNVGSTTVLSERQDLVFRGVDSAPRPAAPAAPLVASLSRSRRADAPLLFRYSALTFNGHRIHYDRRYCVEEENYPGLVVHGPLQATLLLHFARTMRQNSMPSSFAFRGQAPLFDGAFSVNGRETDRGVHLWTADPSGRTTMSAEAAWA